MVLAPCEEMVTPLQQGLAKCNQTRQTWVYCHELKNGGSGIDRFQHCACSTRGREEMHSLLRYKVAVGTLRHGHRGDVRVH